VVLHDPPGRIHHLREHLDGGGTDRTLVAEVQALLSDAGDKGIRLGAQGGVRRPQELRPQPNVEEGTGPSEEQRHADGERQREPELKRQAHPAGLPSAGRHDPRTVSMDRTPNGRSTFSRRYFTYTSTTFELPS